MALNALLLLVLAFVAMIGVRAVARSARRGPK